ncbi:MAG: ABC transporter permease [Lachnotalea sp.]
MRKLIKLELKRVRLYKKLVTFCIVNILITLLVFMIMTLNVFSSSDINNMAFSAPNSIDILVKAFFIVWEAVLITQIIIEEFKCQTLSILYSYPINRKNLLKAKLTIIVLMIFAGMMLSQIIQNVIFALLSIAIGYIQYQIDMHTIINIILTTIGSIFCGLISFGVGMIKRSVAATIISSIVIVSTTVSTQGNERNLMAMLSVSVCLGIIGFIITLFTVNKVISNDLYL